MNKTNFTESGVSTETESPIKRDEPVTDERSSLLKTSTQQGTQRFASYLRLAGWVVLIVGAAAFLGWNIATERWLVLLAVAALPLVLLWPVPAALGAFAFLVPFDMITVIGQDGGGGATLARYVGAAAGLVLLVMGLLRRRLERPMASALWWSLFVFWGAVSSAWAIDPNRAIAHIPTTLALLILYLAASSVHLTRKELSGAVLLTITGGLGAGLASAYQYYNGVFYHGGTMGRSSLIIGDRELDPNIFAASLFLPLSLALGRFLEARGWMRRTFWLAITAAIGTAVLLTMSRGALLALVVMVVVFILRMGVKRQVLIPVTLVLLMLPLLPSRFYTRVEESESTGGAGRLYIWQTGFEAFRHYPLIGAGEQNFSVAAEQYLGAASQVYSYSQADSHNSYLAVAVELGIVGLALMFMAIRSSLREARIGWKGPPVISLVALEAACWAMLASTFFVSMLWRKAFWLPFILLALAVRIHKEQKNDRQIAV